MTDHVQPSLNPAESTGEMTGAMRQVLRKFLMSSVDDMLPVRVIAYDRSANRATVQPQILVVATDGSAADRNQYASIPVLNLGGGGFILSFNILPGDLGWIKAADRDIAEFLKTFAEAEPPTGRIHDFSNGIFIPDVMTGYSINSDDEGAAVLQSTDGSVRVSLFPDKLKLTAPNVIIDGDAEITGAAALGGTGGQPIARLGDTVQVIVSSGSSAGTHTGTITGGSSNHTAT